MQEITVPKVKSIADQILELPTNSAVVVKRGLTLDGTSEVPYDFILRVAENRWVAGRGMLGETQYLTRDDVRSLVERYVFQERRFFELYNPTFGWL